MDSVTLFNVEDPTSVISVVPTGIRGKILELQESHPELLDLDETELRFKLWGDKKPPPPYLNIIRLNFWMEYHQSLRRPTKNFFIDRSYNGVVSAPLFYKLVNNPGTLAWILCEPISYESAINEGLQKAMAEMRAILDLPSLDAKGKPNKVVIEAKIKVFALFDSRKNGAFTQKIENKNLTLTADMRDVQNLVETMTDEDLDKRLAALEARSPELAPTKPVIELEASEYTPSTVQTDEA